MKYYYKIKVYPVYKEHTDEGFRIRVNDDWNLYGDNVPLYAFFKILVFGIDLQGKVTKFSKKKGYKWFYDLRRYWRFDPKHWKRIQYVELEYQDDLPIPKIFERDFLRYVVGENRLKEFSQANPEEQYGLIGDPQEVQFITEYTEYKVKALSEDDFEDFSRKHKDAIREIYIGVAYDYIEELGCKTISQYEPEMFLSSEAKKYLGILIRNLPNNEHFSKNKVYIVKEKLVKAPYVAITFRSSFRKVQDEDNILVYRDVTSDDYWTQRFPSYKKGGAQGSVKRSNFQIIYNRETEEINFLAEKSVRKKALCNFDEKNFRALCNSELSFFNEYNSTLANGMYIDKRSRNKSLYYYMFMPDLGLPLKEFMPNEEQLDRYDLDLKERLRIIVVFLNKLKRLHDAGYVHNDIHDGNILYNPDTGEVSLIDFGLAGRIGEVPLTIRYFKCYPFGDKWRAAFYIKQFLSGEINYMPQKNKESINKIFDQLFSLNERQAFMHSEVKEPVVRIEDMISVFKTAI